MLKQLNFINLSSRIFQPPSGGCVLKPWEMSVYAQAESPAAFGRLCVETCEWTFALLFAGPAAFGRLCVETRSCLDGLTWSSPAAFGRLCVETFLYRLSLPTSFPAAFGRLCVETNAVRRRFRSLSQPPSGGCVLKLGGRVECHEFVVPAAFGRLCVETA